MRIRLRRLFEGPVLPAAAVLLVGIRFGAPSTAAALGVQGIDTAPLDTFIAVYDALVPILAAGLIAILVREWPGARGWDPGSAAALIGVAASLVFWAGEVDPAARLVTGAWSTLPLALSVSATIGAAGLSVDSRLARTGATSRARCAFRALYASFAASYLLGGLRFIDYRTAIGAPLSSGALWLLDYAPTLILCAVAVGGWVLGSARPAPGVLEVLRFLGPPLAGAVAGVAVAQGLGGFILSNVLAWGGGYEVFVPTTVSLAIVGFAVGAFVAAAWSFRGSMPAASWRLAFGGVCATALSGILFFGGALASLAGILLGLLLVARALHTDRVPQL